MKRPDDEACRIEVERLPAGPAAGVTPRRVRFEPVGRVVDADAGQSLYDVARMHGVRVVGACGGRGHCGSCMVRVPLGSLEVLDVHGAKAFDVPLDAQGRPRHALRWMRSCQVAALTDCTVEISPRSLAPVVRAEAVRAGDEVLALDPAVQATDLELDRPGLADDRCDAERVLDACGLDEQARAHASFDTSAAPGLARALREGDGPRARLRAWRCGDEFVAFGSAGARSLGLAIDLGTTNLAGFLVDLDRGEELARVGVENPQSHWGADLVSRIDHAGRDPRVATALRDAAVEAINALAHDLARSVGQEAPEIVDLALCGNTAMQHLLLGLPVGQLGRAPFVAVLRDAVDLRARELGIAVAPGARMHVAAGIGGFVGGDHVAALLATEPHWGRGGCALVMDIGTNTEITLVHGDRMVCASSPSGPALEGGNISCGMRAAQGAVERVVAVDGRLAVKTIGGEDAVGLCGSGVIDALAALQAAGAVDRRGRLQAGHPDVAADDRGRLAARIAPDVLLTQDDVRSIQLAKAAIRTAVELLLAEAGVSARAIERFVIAGAFGAYIDVDSAIAIGLLPPLAGERFLQVGNAAGLGVRRMLASRRDREHARRLARRCRALPLHARPEFQKTFLQHLGLPDHRS